MEKKTARPREGYVMVELSEELRRMLEILRDKRTEEMQEPANFASTVRSLIRADFKRRKLTMEGE